MLTHKSSAKSHRSQAQSSANPLPYAPIPHQALQDPKITKSALQTLQVLLELARAAPSISISIEELAERQGVKKRQTINRLNTLLDSGWVREEKENSRIGRRLIFSWRVDGVAPQGAIEGCTTSAIILHLPVQGDCTPQCNGVAPHSAMVLHPEVQSLCTPLPISEEFNSNSIQTTTNPMAGRGDVFVVDLDQRTEAEAEQAWWESDECLHSDRPLLIPDNREPRYTYTVPGDPSYLLRSDLDLEPGEVWDWYQSAQQNVRNLHRSTTPACSLEN